MSDTLVHTTTTMGTVVTFQVSGRAADRPERTLAIDRAVEWFRQINDICTRFDPASELSRLTARIGSAVPVSALLFQAIQFAKAVAEESDGAFDPTVGHRMERRGFNREHRTGRVVDTGLPADTAVSYRDIEVDADGQTVTLLRPLLLDLGAVAKGLAIDMAVRELQSFTDFAIDAGGDLYLGGTNPDGEAWVVGIRHPRDTEQVLATLHVSDQAVCTSGDYERRSPADETEHHIMDPRSGTSAGDLISTTVVAPSAMVADALATAAFVLGPSAGLRFLERQGVEGLLVKPDLTRLTTGGMQLA